MGSREVWVVLRSGGAALKSWSKLILMSILLLKTISPICYMKKEDKGAATEFIRNILTDIHNNLQSLISKVSIHLKKIEEYFFGPKTPQVSQE